MGHFPVEMCLPVAIQAPKSRESNSRVDNRKLPRWSAEGCGAAPRGPGVILEAWEMGTRRRACVGHLGCSLGMHRI